MYKKQVINIYPIFELNKEKFLTIQEYKKYGEYLKKKIEKDLSDYYNALNYEYKISTINGFNILYDNYYVIYNNNNKKNVNKSLLNFLNDENTIIVDPANTGNMNNLIKKSSPIAGYASGAIYELYNFDKIIDYDQIIFTDYSDKQIKNYEAIGIKYKDKGWIIHVTGPSSGLNYEKNMITTYTSIFEVFIKILKLEKKKYNLRLSLVGLGSFLPHSIKSSTNFTTINNYLNEKILSNILDEGKFIELKENKILIALGEEFNK